MKTFLLFSTDTHQSFSENENIGVFVNKKTLVKTIKEQEIALDEVLVIQLIDMNTRDGFSDHIKLDSEGIFWSSDDADQELLDSLY